MQTSKRSEAAMELINEFKTHDLTRQSSSEFVKPSRFKITTKQSPIPAARNVKPKVKLCLF